ncbi:MAG TPA: class I SAM-dependent methyltransferase [Baekduia sp.]|nr:class I SAM-dependent methyltransferase [Baekduia sp.]
MTTATTAIRRASRGIERYGLAAFTKEVALRGARPALTPLAAVRLRRVADRTHGVEALLDLTFGFDALGVRIAPLQSRHELSLLLHELEQQPPRRMLEIGTANGGSLFPFARVAAPDAHIISVDLPHGRFGGGYPRYKVPLYRAFARRSQRLDLIRADSHAPETVARVRELLGGEPLDFLFIDGDHTYDGVKADFESYSQLVRPGGLVGFHDISAPVSAERLDGADVFQSGDVPRYWQEVRAGRDARELVDPSLGGCFGIGILRL